MATTFSYAQAAKGQTMSRSASQEGSTPPQNEVHQIEVANVQQEKKKTLGLGIDMSKTKAVQQLESPPSPVQDLPVDNHLADQSNGSTKMMSSKTEQADAVSPSESSNHIPKSLGEGKDSSTPEVSEPNWEKVSHDSQSERTTEKGDDDLATSKSSTSERSRPQMKEAPVPVFNVWHKRMEDAQTKVPSKPVSSNIKSEHLSLKNGDVESQHLPSKKPAPVRSSGADPVSQQRMAKPVQTTAPTVNATLSSSDVNLWPTPDLAKVEEKKKETDLPDIDKPATKSHGKEKWEKIDFVPTAVFSTPLPIRGGVRGGRTGGRSGRDSISRGGNNPAALGGGVDRTNLTNGDDIQGPMPGTMDRSKFRDSNATRGGAVYKTKRSSSAGPGNFHDNSQTNESSFEKRDSIGHRTFPNQRSMDHRRTSTSTQTDSVGFNGQEKRSFNPTDSNGEPRFGRSERSFQPRSNTAGNENNVYFPQRDRGEGRPERGSRGNWRSGKPGPSSHANFGSNSHYQQNHGYSNGKSYTEQRHNSHPATFGNGREPRHNRANSRSQSIPNNQAPGRFGVQNGSLNSLPSLQTDMVNAYSYNQPTNIMSAVPFQSYMEHVQLPAMLQMQLEYYLSVDNLCKDIFLRKNMDGRGFVFLHILQNFNRIQTLTTDVNLIKWVCGRSPLIELCTGVDGLDRVRKAEDWQQWVLPVEERDPSAQNDGPAQLLSPRFESFVNGFDMSPLGFPQSHPMSPINPNMMNGYRGESLFESFPQQGQFEPSSAVQTPLTANVPDFKPVQAMHNPYTHLQNGVDFEEKFPDTAFESLQVYVGAVENDAGSVLSKSLEQSLSPKSSHKSDTETQDSPNGAKSTEDHQANGVAQSASGKQGLPNNHAAQRITWTTLTNESDPTKSYQTFYTHGFEQRRNAAIGYCPDAMTDLFEFWSLFLVDNFNIKTYQEFHSIALEDANVKQSLTGLGYLAEFYGRCLHSHPVIADRLLLDFVHLATVEFSNQHLARECPALLQLSEFWKSGAKNSVNYLNLSKMLGEPLRSSLDQGDFAQIP